MRRFVASLDRLDLSLIAIAAVTLAATTLVQCSSSTPVCGNGVVETGEQCDNGPANGMTGSNCTADCRLQGVAIASVQVYYSRLRDEVPGFDGTSCLDLQVDKAHVVLDGPTPKDELWPCSMNSALYGNVMPGTYRATITLLDASGQPITNPVETAMKDVQAAATPVNLTINFHQSDFIKQDYTGALDFNPKWAKADSSCDKANPPVTLEGVTLKTPMGQLVAGMTTQGHKLDGTFGSCFSETTTEMFERIPDLPWGHYNLTLTGKVSGGGLGYCRRFDVFVGPGVANTTYQLVVDPANADAGACP
jgi:hypothetical protein